MGLSIGIVGLPNVGKSTIFNALTRAQNAESANYPFCTIEPNKAVVPVPDPRLAVLAKISHSQKNVYATVDFVDIAGLVKGASQGEGLGNKFLTNIRETDALLHVVRCFNDENIVHVDGAVDPMRDIGVIETELILADYQAVETRVARLGKQVRGDKSVQASLDISKQLLEHLGAGKMAVEFADHKTDAAVLMFKECPLLTDKKMIYCCNVDEAGLQEDNEFVKFVRKHAATRDSETVKICAKMEEDLNGMSEEERVEFLKEYKVVESGLDQIVHTGYHALGLISFLTSGPKEVHAWPIHRGWKAPQAAGVIHSDFEKGFIRAQVISYKDFIEYGGETACRAKGLLRVEGKEYEVQDGDVIEFLFNP